MIPVGPLRRWQYSASLATTRRAQLLVLGDSISEGTGATDVSKRWQTLLQQQLNPDAPTFPFIPAWPNTSAPGMPVTRTGAVRRSGSLPLRWGLGWRTAEIYDETTDGTATGIIIFTFTGTSCAVSLQSASSTGVADITIDGDDVNGRVQVDTNVSATGAAGAFVWESPALPDGVHTVRVRRHPSSVAGQSVWVHGALTHRGDETAGVRVLDASRHGSSSAFTVADTGRIPSVVGSTQTGDGAMQAAGGADLFIMSWGTNDYTATTPEQFRENTLSLIEQARASNARLGHFTGSVLLVGMYKGAGRDEATWTALTDQLAAIAADDPDVAYLDLRRYMPDPDDDTEGLYADALHPSDAGHARIAEIIGRVVAPPKPTEGGGVFTLPSDTSQPVAWAPMVTTWDEPREAAITVRQVIGRADPVVTLSPLSLRAGALDVWFASQTDARMLVELYESGAPVLLQYRDFPELLHVAKVVQPAAYQGTNPPRWHVRVDYQEVAG